MGKSKFIILFLFIFSISLLTLSGFLSYRIRQMPKCNSIYNNQPVPTFPPSPAPTAMPVLLKPYKNSTWKTYSNPDFGLSFSYPPGYTITQSQTQNSITLTSNKNQIGIIKNLRGTGIECLEQISGNTYQSPELVFSVSAYQGLTNDMCDRDPNETSVYVFSTINGNNYFISSNWPTDYGTSLATFLQFMSTLKKSDFTDNWTTHTSPYLHVSLKTPPGYTVKESTNPASWGSIIIISGPEGQMILQPWKKITGYGGEGESTITNIIINNQPIKSLGNLLQREKRTGPDKVTYKVTIETPNSYSTSFNLGATYSFNKSTPEIDFYYYDLILSTLALN